ncbi:enhanced serine sensitivity protein SseB C-terminal domain-containing protein [Streptacidiphilus neutrinimicus]|uniref:enhanced serine sensitivity protein SseB C-terminal domain-containing protein n=1 Tax=Streptacidiphilus neutrinimicus TaxID=105420 RepID=UPI0005A8868D|nr:enhanced serine sensitivity protein SseB C-terminal domain-containing protein [Streptacidiphilus neutrinimicus]
MIESALRELVPGRGDQYEQYETLLHAVAGSQLWMLLWHGAPGGSDAQYGSLEVDGYGYAPCVTSAEELATSGWTRHHQVISGSEVAAALYRERWGLWLNPHQSGGGIGIPWADLRRIAGGLDRLPAGPLVLSTVDSRPPAVPEAVGSPVATAEFFRQLLVAASETPVVSSLRRAWVEPSCGEPYIAIGLDIADSSDSSVASIHRMMRQALPYAPQGLPISTVALADPYDQVAAWMTLRVPPFYERG